MVLLTAARAMSEAIDGGWTARAIDSRVLGMLERERVENQRPLEYTRGGTARLRSTL